jgi:enoyl-CoA hydratase/carnithine racemase
VSAPDAGGDGRDGGGTPRLAIGADGVAVVTLYRPAHLNRLHREDLLALQALFDRVRDEPSVRALVLTGAGRAFCAGFHLGQLGGAPGADPRLFELTVDALEALPLPTVARLNGSVYGGGTDLALACDFRLGVRGMELRMPAARLGLHYYASGLRRAVTRLGAGAAKRMFLLGEALDDAALLSIGYLDRCVAADALDAAVREVTAALAAGAPLAVRGMKCTLDEIARGDAPLAEWRAREDACAASDDLREGLAAFAERRAPRFTGR